MSEEKIELISLEAETVKECMKGHGLTVAVDTIRSNVEVRESQRVWPVEDLAVFTTGRELVVGTGSPGSVKRAMRDVHRFQSPAISSPIPGARMPRIAGPY